MPDTLDPDRIGEVLEACEDNADRLTSWERNFLDSVSEQWEGRHWLSERQREILEKLYVEKIP
jgi:hypothetical protein